MTALCALVALGLGSCANRTATRAQAASPAEIRAFLGEAKRGFAGGFALTYDVTVTYGHRAARRIVVTAAQRSPNLFFYRTTPSIELSGSDGPPASYSFEAFAKPHARSAPGATSGLGAGIYSCRKRLRSSAWSCEGPYTQIGMGGIFQLLGPYPPEALVLALDNAAAVYTGPSPVAPVRHQPAFLTTRRASGHTLRCLTFGPLAHPAGSVCLRRDGLIASYDLPETVTSGVYETATLRSYSRRVAGDAFNLPAKPTGAE